MTFGLVLKYYAANVVHTHLTFTGAMFLCTHFLKKINKGDTFTYYILKNLISSETKLCR